MLQDFPQMSFQSKQISKIQKLLKLKGEKKKKTFFMILQRKTL